MNFNKTKSCPFCDGVNLNFNADDKRLMCDTVECNGCGALVPYAEWRARADGWISVEDELPLENGFVIARSIGITDSVHYTGTLILYFSKAHPKGQQFHSSSRIAPVTCTHWMPLPNPPKAESCGE